MARERIIRPMVKSPSTKSGWRRATTKGSSPRFDPGRTCSDIIVAPGLVVTSGRRVVPNIGWQLVLERCIHGVAEQLHRWIWSKGNCALHDQPLLVVHDDLEALDLVTVHGS